MSSIAYLENSLHSWEKEGFGEFLFMLGRLGFLLAASAAAYAVKRPKRTSPLKPPENGGASTTAEVEAARKEQDVDSGMTKFENEEEEEEEEEEEAEEVKTISSFINATLPSNAPPDVHLDDDDDDDDKLLPKFESLLLLSGEMDDDDDFPLPENKYDVVVEPADDAPEVERLPGLVKEYDQDVDSSMTKVENEEEEEEKEEEEVKTISSFINATLPSNAPPDVHLDDDLDADGKLPPEFESLLLLSGEMGDDDYFPLPENKYDVVDVEPADDAPEVERLRGLVKELEERQAGLEGELLAYYALEEELTGLQKQLAAKTEEVETLNATIRLLREEVAAGAAAAEELEVLRSENKVLQRRIQLDADATTGWTTPW